MEQYLTDNVEKYVKATGIDRARLRKVATPFLDESKFDLGTVDEDLHTQTYEKAPRISAGMTTSRKNKKKKSGGAAAHAAGGGM